MEALADFVAKVRNDDVERHNDHAAAIEQLLQDQMKIAQFTDGLATIRATAGMHQAEPSMTQPLFASNRSCAQDSPRPSRRADCVCRREDRIRKLTLLFGEEATGFPFGRERVCGRRPT
jgi:ABC-type phosphate/phosphonate transport system substrate-binding protein